ncbi:unnamed protein product, partial [Polarella glacialis]
MPTLRELKPRELGSTIRAPCRLGGSSLAWPVFQEADKLRLNVGLSGLSALLSGCERGPWPSRRSMQRELRLLLRCRGEVQPVFGAVAAARAAEAGDAPKALQLLDRLL